MKKVLDMIPIIIVIIAIPSFFCAATCWGTITNIMEEKHSFIEAIEAFKKGATIYKVREYSRTEYGSETRTANGRTKKVFGTFEKDGDIKEGLYFNLDDVMSDQWVIKWPKEEGK